MFILRSWNPSFCNHSTPSASQSFRPNSLLIFPTGEIVQVIADFLVHHHPEPHKSRLRQKKTYFSWCLRTIQPVFFHDVLIMFDARCLLEEVTKEAVEKLTRANAFRHVRRPIAHENYNSLIIDTWNPPTLSELECRDYSTRYTPRPHARPARCGSDPEDVHNIWQSVVDLIGD